MKSGKLTVQSDEQAVQDTKLYAPEDGTIVSLSGQVGETVSGSGTTKASSASSSSSGSASGAAGGAGGSASGARSGSTSSSGSSSASSSSGSGSSSSFAVLSDLNSMQLVVPLSESEVGNVKAGQIATVTVEALEGSKLAAHVREVAILATSTSGAVSYDVTFQLDQMQEGLKPGMSATAEVVVKQAEGVNVPTTAISGGAVTVIENGKQVRRRVVTGLKGNSSTIILSGLKAGEKVLLPVGDQHEQLERTRRRRRRPPRRPGWRGRPRRPRRRRRRLLQRRWMMVRRLRRRSESSGRVPRQRPLVRRAVAGPSAGDARRSRPVIEVHDVTKIYRAGTDSRAGPAQRLAANRLR